MVEYRPVQSPERDRYERIRQYAFHPDEGPWSSDAGDGATPGTRYGLFDDGRLVSICRQYTFDARLRGEWIDIGGLGTVATPPEHRREGYARRLLAGAVRSYATDSIPLITLWPFETAFYRQFGWTTANKVSSYECDPEALVGLGDGEGTFRTVGPDEWESLRDAHLAAGESETLSLRRSETWWRRRIFSKWGDQRRHVYRYDRDGEPAGYVAHSIADDHLDVSYMGSVNHAAYRALLGFLGSHSAQIERITFGRAAESELFDLVTDPAGIECTVKPGPMVRVTDVVQALETMPYPDDVTETVTLTVSDPLVASNDGTVRLRVANGTGAVEQVSDVESDAALSVATLSAIVVGSRNATTAIRHGDLTVAKPGVRERLDHLFPGTRVFLREFF